jgi:hypothetical protein
MYIETRTMLQDDYKIHFGLIERFLLFFAIIALNATANKLMVRTHSHKEFYFLIWSCGAILVFTFSALLEKFLEQTSLTEDIKDIAGIESLFYLLGFTTFYLPTNWYEIIRYISLAFSYGITLVYLLRLCWPVTDANRIRYLGWPIIGFLGIYRYLRKTRNDGHVTQKRQMSVTYLSIVMAFASGIGLSLTELKAMDVYSLYIFLGFAIFSARNVYQHLRHRQANLNLKIGKINQKIAYSAQIVAEQQQATAEANAKAETERETNARLIGERDAAMRMAVELRCKLQELAKERQLLEALRTMPESTQKGIERTILAKAASLPFEGKEIKGFPLFIENANTTIESTFEAKGT